MKDIARYFLIGFVVAMTIYFITLAFRQPAGSALLQEAEESYSKGEKASTIAERQQYFNKALTAYRELVAEYQPRLGSGKLYFNLANTYFQLEEYSWAVFYYYKALKLAPGDEEVERNLTAALSKLGLAPQEEGRSWQSLLFLQDRLSLPSQLQLFFVFALAVFGAASAYLWYGMSWLRYVIAGTGAVLFLLSASLFYQYFLSPLEGVVLKGASLYRDAGTQYAKVSDKPVNPGIKVEVLDRRDKGQWLKVQTPDGAVGYITLDAIVLL